MEERRRILLITFDNWGYNQYIANALEKKNCEVIHINFHSFQYKYPNFYYKTLNFFTKNIGLYNLKKDHYHEIILNELKGVEKIDNVIYIKADFLYQKTIKAINARSQKSVLLINDSISRYPRTKNILGLFDEVFSFEKRDCEKYKLTFKTNFIYKFLKSGSTHFEYKVFNISSFDDRFPAIRKIAEKLYRMNVKSKIMIFTCNEPQYPYLEYTKEPVPIDEINKLAEQSEIMLDVKRNGQNGLSFRVFESLGLHKKLITTNKDVVNYDFYNENNILVIDEAGEIDIPETFLQTPYREVPENILEKYLVENWVNELVD